MNSRPAFGRIKKGLRIAADSGGNRFFKIRNTIHEILLATAGERQQQASFSPVACDREILFTCLEFTYYICPDINPGLLSILLRVLGICLWYMRYIVLVQRLTRPKYRPITKIENCWCNLSYRTLFDISTDIFGPEQLCHSRDLSAEALTKVEGGNPVVDETISGLLSAQE